MIILSPPSQQQVLRWVRKLVEQLNRDYLLHFAAIFGSYSDGTYNFGSDLDLIIVYDKSSPLTFEEILTIALEISYDL